MVKGISRQVIVVQGPKEEIFDQAIFILKDKAVSQGLTDEMLLKEAQKAIRSRGKPRPRGALVRFGNRWACAGAAITAGFWAASLWL